MPAAAIALPRLQPAQARSKDALLAPTIKWSDACTRWAWVNRKHPSHPHRGCIQTHLPLLPHLGKDYAYLAQTPPMRCPRWC